MKAERVVLDTNVLISAALQPNGSPRAVVETLRAVRGVLLFSDETPRKRRAGFPCLRAVTHRRWATRHRDLMADRNVRPPLFLATKHWPLISDYG